MLRIVKLTLCVTLLAVAASSFANAEDSKKADQKKTASTEKKAKHPVYGQTMKSLTGKETKLSKYRGKVLLLVNTASECGATPQYDPLQGLHKKYAEKGLAVVGFPCNQFGSQEPGSESEIASFCKKNYGVEFDMFGKVDVNGEKAAPLFKYLTSKESGLKKTGPIGWNFEKILLSRRGKPVARFGTGVEPDSEEVLKAIEAELAKEAPKKRTKKEAK
ncbi:MAG: glutathione peroxidase [Planctomycetales bacterium]|jgi:glutathione peroxidase